MNTVKIAGIDRLTLLDYPGKTAAILFLPGCNMRCPFCHNAELARGNTPCMDYKEAMTFLEKRRNLLDGVVITGGEPSVQEIRPLLIQIKNMGYSVKIDTNGTDPAAIRSWIGEGLADYIAMDIKNSLEKYGLTAGCAVNPDATEDSIYTIIHSNIGYEFRTTVADGLHEPEDIAEICRDMIPGAERYFIQPFRKSPEVPDGTLGEPSDAELLAMLDIARLYVKHAEIRGRDIGTVA